MKTYDITKSEAEERRILHSWVLGAKLADRFARVGHFERRGGMYRLRCFGEAIKSGRSRLITIARCSYYPFLQGTHPGKTYNSYFIELFLSVKTFVDSTSLYVRLAWRCALLPVD
jgi:hypothetical protein